MQRTAVTCSCQPSHAADSRHMQRTADTCSGQLPHLQYCLWCDGRNRINKNIEILSIESIEMCSNCVAAAGVRGKSALLNGRTEYCKLEIRATGNKIHYTVLF
jgi:hypothetical protein